MTDREQYTPGPASGAQIRKDGEKWTLILVRELRHSPEKVWRASPMIRRIYASGRRLKRMASLGTVGASVNLTLDRNGPAAGNHRDASRRSRGA